MGSVITLGGSAAVGSGFTYGDLIEKTYRRVMSGMSEMVVLLSSDLEGYASSNIYFSGPQVTSLVPGAILSIDLELMLVLAVNSGSGAVSVERGYMGSVAVPHVANSLCYINSSLTRFDIGVAINDDLASLSGLGLVRINSAEITYNPVFMGYDLGDMPNNFIEILEIRYKHPFPDRRYPPITRWKVSRYQDTSIFPSGNSLTIYENGYPGMPIYVTYSAPLLPYVALTDDVCQTVVTNDQNPPYNGYPEASSTLFDGSTVLDSNLMQVSLSDLAKLQLYQGVVGDNLQDNTVITGISKGTGTITLSLPALTTGTYTMQALFPTSIENLPPTAIDIPPLGAMIQLVQVREFSRNNFLVQPDPRKAVDVIQGAIMNSTQRLETHRMQRIEEEVARIRKQYTRHPHR